MSTVASYPYFQNVNNLLNDKRYTAASHVIKWFPQRARHLFDFHVSPETYSTLCDAKGGLASHWLATRPELSASLAFQVTMWSSGSQETISNSPVLADIQAAYSGWAGTGDYYDDLVGLATDQAVALPADVGNVTLGATQPFVTVTLFANYNANTQTRTPITFPVYHESMMHVSAAYIPPDAGSKTLTIDELGPIAISRTIISASQAPNLTANNLYDILTHQRGNQDEDALMYFNLRIRQPGDTGAVADDLIPPFHASTVNSNLIDIMCFNKNGRVELGALYVDALSPTSPWFYNTELAGTRVTYEPREHAIESAFIIDEQLEHVEQDQFGNQVTTYYGPTLMHRSSSLATNQRTHTGIGLSHDLLNKMTVNLTSMRHMHRWGFLGQFNTPATNTKNDFRPLWDTLERRASTYSGSQIIIDCFYDNTEATTDAAIEYFAAPSWMPSGLLGIAFYTGNDVQGTVDRNSNVAHGLVTEEDLERDGLGSFDLDGSPWDNLAYIPEVKQRVTGSFGHEATAFFSCLVRSPFASGDRNPTLGSNRMFDDRYNAFIGQGVMGSLRPEVGPDTYIGDNYIWVDTGRAEMSGTNDVDTVYSLASPGIVGMRVAASASMTPHQYFNTREIPKPLHMDHMTRNDPDSGFDVG